MPRHAMTRLPGGLSAPTVWLGALGLSCLSLACARTSEERVLAISRLLEESRELHAADYAPEALSQAEDLLSRVRAELETQRSKPWFLSTYRRSRELLQESEAAASLARAEAAAGAVRARQEAGRAVTAAHAAIDQASEAYWHSPRGKDARIDLLRMRSDLDALLGDLIAAELSLEGGDFLHAGSLATDVMRRAEVVGRTITRATASRIDDSPTR